MKSIRKLVLDYVRNEMGHEDATIVRMLVTTSDEALVLVSTDECGRFAILVVGNQVDADSISEQDFLRNEERFYATY